MTEHADSQAPMPRRRYALLQAAATIYTVNLKVTEAVDIAENLLSEIEMREEVL